MYFKKNIMKKSIKLTGKELMEMISESVKRALIESADDSWYDEEDYDGKTGEPGMVRSYEVGMISFENAENEAEQQGMSVEDYLKEWFFEIQPECPWYWQKLGSGYGYHGNTIFVENGVTCKEIHGQLMFDERPRGDAEYDHDFENRLQKGEFWTK